MNLRSLHIAGRSLLCFCILALLLVGVGLSSLVQMSEIRATSQVIERVTVPAILASDKLSLMIASVRIDAVRITAPGVDQGAVRKRIVDNVQAIEASFTDYEPLISSASERTAFDELHKLFQAYFRQVERLEKALDEGRVAEAVSLAGNDMADLGQQMNGAVEKLRAINHRDVTTHSEAAIAYYTQAKISIGVAIVTAILLTLLLAWRLTTSLVGPIRQAVQAAKTIAEGDLSQRLDVSGHDEAAQLLQAMQQMQNRLRDALGSIGDSAQQLTTAAEEVNAVMEASVEDLQQQNSEVEMAAAAVTEMSQAVEEVADNATSTSAHSHQVTDTAQQGQRQLNDTLGAIERLTDNVLGASDQARQLAEQTRNISQVLDVIRSVAEQTNLLALNAAIEAARAGEAGRGFAVVADEVRALAHRTGESTREIEGMISSIQQGTGQTVDALLTSADQARQTREQAQAASAALATIVTSVAGIDERNLLIASASEEQAVVAREVDRNLVRIRDLSVQSATGAAQTRSATQHLAALAASLTGQVRRFHL